MIAIAHVLLGILIGKSFSNLFLVALFALISHFILDAIPHLDVGSFKRRREDYTPKDWGIVAFDIILGVALVLYFTIKFEFWPIIFGAAFAILPDVVDGLSWLFRIDKLPFFKGFHKLHDAIGFKLTRDLVWLGVFLEAVVILAVISVLLFV